MAKWTNKQLAAKTKSKTKPNRKAPAKATTLRIPTEEEDQTALCLYIKKQYPSVLYTVDMAAGQRGWKMQSLMTQQRCGRGHPDMILQEWLGNVYCGLAIELKRVNIVVSDKSVSGKSKVSQHQAEQLQYLLALRERQYLAVFVSGYDNAKLVIDLYLEGNIEALKKINDFVYPKVDFDNIGK